MRLPYGFRGRVLVKTLMVGWARFLLMCLAGLAAGAATVAARAAGKIEAWEVK
jgi:hypothetical protein